jgi:hypothetical protein
MIHLQGNESAPPAMGSLVGQQNMWAMLALIVRRMI